MSHPIADLLKRALLVGASEVRLVPGRRTIVVVPQGESEVKGDPQTPEKISSLLTPVLTPAAKQHLATGFAAWDFDLEGRGPVRACAELKLGMVHVSFFLDRCETLAKLGERAPQRVAPAPAPLPFPAPRAAYPSPPPLGSGIDTDDEVDLRRPAALPTQRP